MRTVLLLSSKSISLVIDVLVKLIIINICILYVLIDSYWPSQLNCQNPYRHSVSVVLQTYSKVEMVFTKKSPVIRSVLLGYTVH